jgi:large subunit ribosomal protein L5
MMMTKERVTTAYEALKEEYGYKNRMAAPRIVKVIVSSGVGKKRDKKVLELIENRLSRITGQKPASRAARISIASFKVREGDTVGYQITLRGARMYDFLDKLIHVALPRTRDFRGISSTAVDDMGNMTIGIKEHTIFPETSDEEVKDVFGLAVTVVTTAKNKEDATAFFKHLGVPLRDKAEKK